MLNNIRTQIKILKAVRKGLVINTTSEGYEIVINRKYENI